MASLSIIDAIVLVAYLAGVVGLGVWLGRGQQDAKRYLLGDKQSPWWAILGSIVATETSTVTFLSVPGIAFAKEGDLRFLQLAIGYIVGRIAIVVWLLPLYFRGELFTAYDLISQRFGEPTRKLASLIFLVTRNLGGRPTTISYGGCARGHAGVATGPVRGGYWRGDDRVYGLRRHEERHLERLSSAGRLHARRVSRDGLDRKPFTGRLRWPL